MISRDETVELQPMRALAHPPALRETGDNAGIERNLHKELAEKEHRLKKRFDEIAALTRALREKEIEIDGLSAKLRDSETERSRLTEALREKERQLDSARALEGQLADRFEEIAQLTTFVNEAEAAARMAAADRDCLIEIAAILAGGARSWKIKLYGVLPAGILRARQMAELKRKGLFDARAYLAAHPDVARAKVDPLHHYVRHGLKEGRAPNLPGISRS